MDRLTKHLKSMAEGEKQKDQAVSISVLKKELLSLMPVQSCSDWGPQPIICRWCDCWLEYGDDYSKKPKESHKKECFAAKYLGRPSR